MNVLITGWSKWIWKALVDEYLKKWHRVFCIARNEMLLQTLKIDHSTKPLYILKCDISSSEDLKVLINELWRINFTPNLVIHNVWVGYHSLFQEMSDIKIAEVIQTNLLWTIKLTKLLLEKYIESLNRIAFLSSLAWKVGFSWLSVYSASKFWIEWFAESLRQELREKNIWISIIRPGIVDTHFFEYAHMDQYVENIRNKMQTPEFVARQTYLWLSQWKDDFTIGKDKVFLFLKRFIPKSLEWHLMNLFIN